MEKIEANKKKDIKNLIHIYVHINFDYGHTRLNVFLFDSASLIIHV